MSRFRPAMPAPRRPMNATSAPSADAHAATLAPEPPPCVVTLAGVSLPRASGSVAGATVSVIKSLSGGQGPELSRRCVVAGSRRPEPDQGTPYGIFPSPMLATAAGGSYRIGNSRARGPSLRDVFAYDP